MQNYAGTVQDVLNTFVSPVVPNDQEETGKAQLTRAAAWEINKIDPNVGLLKKTGGNQVNNLSVDVISDRSNGDWVDIATSTDAGSGMRNIVAIWLHHDGTLPGELWVQPTQELALLPGPMTRSTSVDPGPGPVPPPSEIVTTNDDLMRELVDIKHTLDQMVETQAMDTAKIIAKGDANTAEIMDRIWQVVEDAETSGKKILALWLASQNRPPEGGGEQPPPDEVVPPDGAGLLLLLLKAMSNRP